MNSKKKILVIGGVAAGASFAARCRRLDEEVEIIVLERGPDVSFANCGLPYYVGGEISDRDALAVQTPQSLQAMLKLDVRTRSEARSINLEAKTVEVANLDSGDTETVSYDALMLAPGAKPIVPPLPGIDDPRIHTLRNLQDMDRIKAMVSSAKRAVVVGAGFIGLEMTEQLKRLGLEVTIVEMQSQVLPQLDPEMSMLMESELKQQGIEVVLHNGIKGFHPSEESLSCELQSGDSVEADLVLLSIGVKPDTEIAREAGLELGPREHIVVDTFQRTSEVGVYAAGDAVQTIDRTTGQASSVPLGGPANRQGRVAADHLFLGEKARPYPGSLGTAIVRVFSVAAGLTGWTERRLKAEGCDYRVTMVNDNHHAGYYPGAKPMTLKLLWDPQTLQVLGAQATGFEGVDKRLDVLATAIVGKMTVEDLCHLELSYAPPFGSAKDIVNLAGFAATNVLDDLVEVVHTLPESGEAQVVDVRPGPLYNAHPSPGSINIPFPTLRSSLDKLDREKPVVTICAFGKMSYFAARVLKQNGFQVVSYSGGIKGSLDPRSPAKLVLG
ncbi:FAD-dependent oxidoreductase [Pelagicoccus albus]|uniref:FAD-dependent oxidoreductase n=1 Tax=Pelagicoccus albus TaxID=415222 RepID=A0A7X1EAZ1_9BACT|nr:FAD-dependent oxidoreductase [Pelagicoccus albus]MBC2607252.1 FAD-dependent oxidoreductase [Pelagicoccus albus]